MKAFKHSYKEVSGNFLIMKHIILVFLIAITLTNELFAEDPNRNFKIVGGHETKIENHPHQLRIVVSADNSGKCGASLISSTVAITAAHCVSNYKPNELGMKAGITSLSKDKGVFSSIKTIIIHPQYKKGSLHYDIALLRLATSLLTSKSVKPIPLARRDAQLTGSEYVTGWGSVNRKVDQFRHSDILKQARVSLSKKCIIPGPATICTKVSMTTESDSMCWGDSGGPLVSNGYLIGIVSAIGAINKTFEFGCGLRGNLGIYTDVRQYRDWIKQEVGF